MRSSSLFALALAAGALAMPVKRDKVVEITVVTVINTVDQNGNIISSSTETTKQAATPAPEPVPAVVVEDAPVDDTPPPPAKPTPEPAAQPNQQNSVPAQDTGSNGGDPFRTGWIDPTDPDFEAVSVFHHNAHRSNHSVGPVSWDNELAKAAQTWAESCVSEEVIPEGSGYGMNVAFSSSQENYNPSSFISGGWYNDELADFPAYGVPDLPVDGNFMNWGHFSQVVWSDTTTIGCGIAVCNDGWKVHAGCMYHPAGNIIGSFDKVKPPTGGKVLFPNGQTHF